MKCPQLSMPVATAARNQNSIGDRMEKKKLGRNQFRGGGEVPRSPFPVPLTKTNQQFVPTAAKLDCKGSTGSSGLFLVGV